MTDRLPCPALATWEQVHALWVHKEPEKERWDSKPWHPSSSGDLQVLYGDRYFLPAQPPNDEVGSRGRVDRISDSEPDPSWLWGYLMAQTEAGPPPTTPESPALQRTVETDQTPASCTHRALGLAPVPTLAGSLGAPGPNRSPVPALTNTINLHCPP